jgi:hypothetical protein
MNLDKNQPLIRFTDEIVTPDQLLERAQSQLAQRGAPEVNWSDYGGTSLLELPLDSLDLFNLYHLLKMANEAQAQLEVEPLLLPSPSSRLPVVGRLWQFVRQQAHGLVLFYVNRSVGQQAQLNHSLTQTLNELARLVIEQRQEIAALRQQLGLRKEGE